MSSISSKFMSLHFLILLALLRNAASSSSWVINTLPGFSGELPFKLQTGYVSVGEIEFFYYFVESLSGNSATDPLILYLNGGPGCSGLNGLFFQAGPLEFNMTYTGGIPQVLYYPYSWTKTASIIFVDAPVGTGFTYAANAEAYVTSDSLSAAQTLSFMRNEKILYTSGVYATWYLQPKPWLNDYPNFIENPFYVVSDSYAGLLVPIIAQAIVDDNEAGVETQINLKGYIISCPHTDTLIEEDSRIPYAHRMALVSDALYELAKTSCNGSYTNIDATNAVCLEAVEAITLCIGQVSRQNILVPVCEFLSPKPDEENNGRSLIENSRNSLVSLSEPPDLSCHNFHYMLSDIWTNHKYVQEALHIRPNTTKEWFRCNVTIISESYTEDIDSVVSYHQNLTSTGLQVLTFSGDHDMVMPHVGIEEWIKSLNLTIDSDWRPWFVEGQVAGYTRKYTNDGYRFTYATVKGAGHSPPEWSRKACYDMFHRWIHYFPL